MLARRLGRGLFATAAAAHVLALVGAAAAVALLATAAALAAFTGALAVGALGALALMLATAAAARTLVTAAAHVLSTAAARAAARMVATAASLTARLGGLLLRHRRERRGVCAAFADEHLDRRLSHFGRLVAANSKREEAEGKQGEKTHRRDSSG